MKRKGWAYQGVEETEGGGGGSRGEGFLACGKFDGRYVGRPSSKLKVSMSK